MATELLIVGDIHLGRVPGRLEDAGLRASQFAPSVAWRLAVDLAIDARVDAVLLAGDVVDDESDRFEAYDHLERGVKRLTDQGIAVFGVAGNHDGRVLPLLADRIPAFCLLGRDGNWQRVGLPGDVDVDLLGWSFPGRHHADDPLDSPGLTEALAGRRSGAAILGLLHCDLDGGTSPYAPVARHRLVSMGLDGWFLGHIHVPDDLQGQPPLGYLGSLVGLNRGETGVHGPCRVTIHGPGRLAVERVVVGPVVWLDVEVSASGVSDDASAEDELHARIQRAFQLRAETLPQGPDAGDRAVACSVTLVGEVGARARVRDFASKITPAQLRFQVDGQTWIAIRLRDATRPAVDLAVLARQPTPLGVVASLILALETSGPAAHEVQALAKTVIEPFGAGRWQVDDQRHPPGDGGAELLSAARRLLDALLAQAPAQGGG